MKELERAILLVLDSVGIGEAPDAALFGDEGSNTLAHTAEAVGGLHLPHLASLGLGNLTGIRGVPPVEESLGAYGRMREQSRGKDSTTGHWELAGLRLDRPFPTYPDGFPPDVIDAFTRAAGVGVIGNKAASGTAIIEELGARHLETGCPIVYTSADSVFQIAAHESVIPVERLYELCRIARRILQGPHAVGRVIARPFTGEPGRFRRTPNRKDFSLEPPAPTVLDEALSAGIEVVGIGKVVDLFAGKGIARAVHTSSNDETVSAVAEAFGRAAGPTLIVANCVDFDAVWGHRNDPRGYAAGLEAFDRRLPELIDPLGARDALFIVADHGCDPTTPSTDHSREWVPLLVVGGPIRSGVDLGARETFSDVAATLADAFGLRPPAHGTSFWPRIRRGETSR